MMPPRWRARGGPRGEGREIVLYGYTASLMPPPRRKALHYSRTPVALTLHSGRR